MGRPDKKQRHKAKREAKKQLARRQGSISPVTRLAKAPGEAEVWMSDSLDSFGQTQIFAFKRGAGLSGIACFLIDRGVVGLKDAWSRMDVTEAEFREMLDRASGAAPMVHTHVDAARQLIAGAVRWTAEHGIRLPNNFERTASVIGGLGDWKNADTSRFSKEFAGHPNDLRRRLVGSSFEEFTSRPDIHFFFSDLAPGGEDESFSDVDDLEDCDDDALNEARLAALNQAARRFGSSATELTEKTKAWLADRGEAPSTELFEAWQTVLASIAAASTLEEPGDRLLNKAGEFMRCMLPRLGEARAEAHDAAVRQCLLHFEADNSLATSISLSVDKDDIFVEPAPANAGADNPPLLTSDADSHRG